MSEIMKKEAEKYGIAYEKQGRVLVWHDEFDSNSIDFDNKWSFDHSMGGKDRVYDNSETCCRIEDDKLLLQVHKNDDAEKPYRLPEGFTTRNRMEFKYGYLEMRACIPYRHGAWPGFWMQSKSPFAKASWFSEIDIFEIFSSQRKAVCNIHKWGKNPDGSWCHTSYDGEEGNDTRAYFFKNYENLNNEYHVYGMGWDENFFSFYIDDVLYKQFPIDPVNGTVIANAIEGVEGFHDFHFILLNNEIFSYGGGWSVPGWNLEEDDKFPINYKVDWIRLYQNPEKEEIKFKDEILKKTEEVKGSDLPNAWYI